MRKIMKRISFLSLTFLICSTLLTMAQDILTSIAPPPSGSGNVGAPMQFEASIEALGGTYTNFQWTLSFPTNVVSTPNSPTGEYTWTQINPGTWQTTISSLSGAATTTISVMPIAVTSQGAQDAISNVSGFFENNASTQNDNAIAKFFVEASTNVIQVTPNTSVIAPGQPVTLTASGCTGGAYSWDNGQTGASITVSPNTVGTTTYIVTCSTGGTAQASVTVQNNAISVTPPSSSVTAGTPVTLTASGCNGGTYTWANSNGSPAGTASGTGNNTYTVNAGAGTFQYTVSCSTGGQATASVTGSTTPITVTPPSATVTVGSPQTFTASGCSGGTISWTNGGAAIGSGNSVTVNATAGTQNIVATCSLGGSGSATLTGQAVACQANAGTLN
jgi:hypothetical protein